MTTFRDAWASRMDDLRDLGVTDEVADLREEREGGDPCCRHGAGRRSAARRVAEVVAPPPCRPVGAEDATPQRQIGSALSTSARPPPTRRLAETSCSRRSVKSWTP
jgi:hypothetical protein